MTTEQRECAIRGHDIKVICGLNFDPVQVTCRRCGDSWDVQPKATTGG